MKCVVCEQVVYSKVPFCPYCGASQVTRQLVEAPASLAGELIASANSSEVAGQPDHYTFSGELGGFHFEGDRLAEAPVGGTPEVDALLQAIDGALYRQQEPDDAVVAAASGTGKKSKAPLLCVLLLVVFASAFVYLKFVNSESDAPDVFAIPRKDAESCEEDAATAKSLIYSGRPSKALQMLEKSLVDCVNIPQFEGLKSNALDATKSANDYLKQARKSMYAGQLEKASNLLDMASKINLDLLEIKDMREELKNLWADIDKRPEHNKGGPADLITSLMSSKRTPTQKNKIDERLNELIKGDDEVKSKTPPDSLRVIKGDSNKELKRMDELLNK